MTKQHFEAIAETITKIDNPEIRKQEIEKWVALGKKSNKLFKEDVFRNACKLK